MRSNKSFPLVCILCFVLGSWGVHRFYVGKFVTGILMALTLGGLGVWTLIDFIRIVTGNFKDNQGNVIRQSERKPTEQNSPADNTTPSDSSATLEASTQGQTNGMTKSKRQYGDRFLAIGCLVAVGVGLGLIVTCVISLTVTPELSDADKAAKAEEERKGLHCLSQWDGNHEGLEALIRALLKDPDSMETIETRIAPVDANGNHNVTLKYRARNSFGGMVVEQAFGIVDNDTCEATLLGVE